MNTSERPLPAVADTGTRARFPIALAAVLATLSLQVAVLLPHDHWFLFSMVAPPSIVLSMWLIGGLLAINQPRHVRWEFRLILSTKMRWVPPVLLASLGILPFLSHDPSLRHAYAASTERASDAVAVSWMVAYCVGVCTPLPARLPGTMDQTRVRMRLLVLGVLLPAAALLVALTLAALQPIIR